VDANSWLLLLLPSFSFKDSEPKPDVGLGGGKTFRDDGDSNGAFPLKPAPLFMVLRSLQKTIAKSADQECS
jgi:hypothetical protein